MRIAIPLIGGKLKIKTADALRKPERDRLPVWKIGPIYFVWWSKTAEKFMGKR